MSNSLYIHIPFCNNICSYCDFCKVIYDKGLCDRYVSLITRELSGIDPYKTIYIGGGSPSSLTVDNLKTLFKSLEMRVDKNTEFTIEVNPEDMDEEKVKLFKEFNINRVSIGVQSFDEDLLKLMNRKHNKEMVVNLISLLHKYGIYNINCDLIYGLPNQTMKIIKKDLNTFIKLGVKHISTYALQVEDNTVFKNEGIEALDDDIQAKMYYSISKYLKKKKYIRYEVSNFAKKGFESKHNLVYWNALEYEGLGAGASGYENGVRYDNTRSVFKYLTYEDVMSKEELSDKDKEYEYIILHLRLKNGIDLNEYNVIYKEDFLDKYSKEVKELLKKKLIKIKKNHLFVKENKMFILNQVLQYFGND